MLYPGAYVSPLDFIGFTTAEERRYFLAENALTMLPSFDGVLDVGEVMGGYELIKSQPSIMKKNTHMPS